MTIRPEKLTVAEYDRMTDAERRKVWWICYGEQVHQLRNRRCYVRVMHSKQDRMSTAFCISRNDRDAILGYMKS